MLRTLLAVSPRNNDALTLRRGHALAILMLILIGAVGVLWLVNLLIGPSPSAAITFSVSMALLGSVYAINRSGRVLLAVRIFLAGATLLLIGSAIVSRAPTPALYFYSVLVITAAAFGRPRDPLLWAGAFTGTPFVLNQVLYGSPLALTTAPGVFTTEVTALGLVWMVAGGAYLTTRLLQQAIDESLEAIARAEAAQQALAAQQADLAARNEQLTQVRQHLEALVDALAVPVVPVANGIGLLPLVGPLDAARMHDVEQRTLTMISARRLRALVIDLSGAAGLDAASAEALVRLCSALRLIGVRSMLAGLGARGALLLSSAEIALPPTAATVQDALAILERDIQQN